MEISIGRTIIDPVDGHVGGGRGSTMAAASCSISLLYSRILSTATIDSSKAVYRRTTADSSVQAYDRAV